MSVKEDVQAAIDRTQEITEQISAMESVGRTKINGIELLRTGYI